MKKISLLSILFFVLVHSCTDISEQNNPKEIIIAGKVNNYDINSGKNILTIYINDNGRATQLNFPTRIDSVGNFQSGKSKVIFHGLLTVQNIVMKHFSNIKAKCGY